MVDLQCQQLQKLSTNFVTMGKFTGSYTTFLFWFILLLLTRSIFVVGDDGKENANAVPERSTAEEMFRDAYAALTRTSLSSLDRIKALINELQTKYFPPSVDQDSDPKDGQESVSEKITTAAGKSAGASKEAVEESAKTAANVVGDVVHKTTDKVTGSKHTDDKSHDEL